VLRHGDLSNVQEYYSRPAASGFWLLEYGNTFVGLIAVDATQAKKTGQGETRPPKTALIRHFYVEEPFRSSNIQDDLLKHAVNHAFEKDAKLERIEAPDSPLVAYLRPCLRSAGFELDHHTKKVGFLKWNLGIRYLERKAWNTKEDSK
jgi:GNAT superfamily N-acetyltransferase